MKICSSCKLCKADTEFDSLICTACIKIQDQKLSAKRQCKICCQILPVIQFSKAITNADGLHKWCNICRRDYHCLYSRDRRLKKQKSQYPNTNTIRGYRIRLIESYEEVRKPLPADWNPNLTVSFD